MTPRYVRFTQIVLGTAVLLAWLLGLFWLSTAVDFAAVWQAFRP